MSGTAISHSLILTYVLITHNTVIKYHNQGNFYNKGLSWTDSRRLIVHHGRVASQQACMEAGAAESSHLEPWAPNREQTWNATRFATLKVCPY